MLPKFVLPKIDAHASRTINAYIKHSDKCIETWSSKPKISGLLRTIIKGYCLNNNNTRNLNVLDIGCGLGYDSIIFADIGKCNVYSIDACPQFLDYFKQNIIHAQQQSNKSLDINVIECDFNYDKISENEQLTSQKYDILWNNASLLHLTKYEFNKWLHDIHSICTGNTIFGSLFYAGKDGNNTSNEKYTDDSFVADRYLSEYTKYELSKFYMNNGWKVLLMSPATDYNREGDWIQVLAQQQLNKL